MISGIEWILAGGVLLPVGHWVYLQTQKRRILGQIQKYETPVKGYEVSLITPYGSELFLKSKYTLGKYMSSDLQDCRSSMFDVPITSSFHTLNSFKVQKRGYPKGVFYHSQTRQLSSCSKQLLKDIQYLKMGPSLIVAGICVGITGYSWLSYTMNPYCEKPYFSSF